jgi:hypothetical protein
VNASSFASAAARTRADRVRAALVPLTFLAAAAAALAGPWAFKSPVAPARATPAWATNVAPVRQASLTPTIKLAGFTYPCSDCHRLFLSPPETTRQLTQHRDIHLQHGLNTRCFNCHHRENRNAFVDDGGGEIPYDQPQLLCARCHGTVYRDWQAGVHGRTNGFWDVRQGAAKRLRCIQCHDPHQPPFPSLQPAPGPNTLRMGDQSQPLEVHEHNPLRIFRQLVGGVPAPSSAPAGANAKEHP